MFQSDLMLEIYKRKALPFTLRLKKKNGEGEKVNAFGGRPTMDLFTNQTEAARTLNR